MRRSLPSVVATAAATALALAGCSNSSNSGTDGGSAGTIAIVASTNVYGDIAGSIAGDHATVTSIVTSPSQDPHEYEPSVQDRLAVEDAELVVENGGGFDSFIQPLVEAVDSDPVVIDAVEVSGLAAGNEHAHEHGDDGELAAEEHEHIEGFNEHVWYDFEAVEHVAEEIAHELGDIDPNNAKAYRANYQAFVKQIHTLETRSDKLKVSLGGRGMAITEPVPLYLLQGVGLVNKTPAEFSEAVEEGADVPVQALRETLDLFTDEQVDLLAYNEQTVDSTTEQVQAAAEDAGIPVVSFTETLPEGQHYAEWMSANLDSLARAVG